MSLFGLTAPLVAPVVREERVDPRLSRVALPVLVTGRTDGWVGEQIVVPVATVREAVILLAVPLANEPWDSQTKMLIEIENANRGSARQEGEGEGALPSYKLRRQAQGNRKSEKPGLVRKFPKQCFHYRIPGGLS